MPGTPGPKSTAVSAVQPANAFSPISVAPLKPTDVRLVQYRKQLLPSVVTLAGMSTDVRPSQPLKP